MFIKSKRLFGMFLVTLTAVLLLGSGGIPQVEIREYEGKRLDPFDRAYDNSIKGPQDVDLETYRLELTGLVEHPQSLTYQQVGKSIFFSRVCVWLICSLGPGRKRVC